MGQRLVIVVLSPGWMCLIHSVSVECSRFCAISTGELAFLPPLDLSVYCRIQWRRPSRKLLGFPWGLGLLVLSMVWVLFDFFPVLSWVFSPGVGRGSLSRVWLHQSGRFWLLGAGSRPVSPLRSLAPSHSGVCAVRVTVHPLFPRLLRLALPYGLTVSPLPHYRWSRVHGQASAGLICWVSALWGLFVVLPRQLVGSGVYSPASPNCPTSSVLERSSFGISASGFASSLRDGVTLPGRVCLSPRSERSLFLHLPGVWLESSRWGHPVGSRLSQISIGTMALCAPSLVVGV